jgi:hypothetical protein
MNYEQENFIKDHVLLYFEQQGVFKSKLKNLEVKRLCFDFLLQPILTIQYLHYKTSHYEFPGRITLPKIMNGSV